MHLVIMNFRDSSLHFFTMEEPMDTEQIEEWITDETDFNLDEVHYMASETPFQLARNNYTEWESLTENI